MLSTKNQYDGFISTPPLWINPSDLIGIDQFLELNNHNEFIPFESQKIRLGNLVEQFTFQSLRDSNEQCIIGENIQIFDGKITIGELDCLLKHKNTIFHLEIVYKFYVFKPDCVVSHELEGLVGPNLKDSFLEKLNKLKSHQFPLLYHSKTKDILSKFNILDDFIFQKTIFKAQVFVPLGIKVPDFSTINPDCILGYYCSLDYIIEHYSNSSFHIPCKHDWLITPHNSVKWFKIKTLNHKVCTLFELNKSPMCWIKTKDNIFKVFIVWWG